MNPIGTLLIASVAALGGAVSGYAQDPSPREQFQAAVAAYQKSASEETAQKLAELFKKLDPPPAVPEEADFRALKGAAFVKQAGNAAAFAKAATEFRAAILAAPWVGEYHYNLAVCEKSAGQFSAAQAALKLAKVFARDDKERKECLVLRAELEAAQELAVAKVEEEKVAAAKAANEPKAREAALMKSLEGATFSFTFPNIKRTYRISKGQAVPTDRRLAAGGFLCSRGDQKNGPIGEEMECLYYVFRLVGRHGERKHNFGTDTCEISEDGQTLIEKDVYNGKVTTETVYKRQ